MTDTEELLDIYTHISAARLQRELPKPAFKTRANFVIISFMAARPNSRADCDYSDWRDYAGSAFLAATGEQLPVEVFPQPGKALHLLGSLAFGSIKVADSFDPTPPQIAQALLNDDPRITVLQTKTVS